MGFRKRLSSIVDNYMTSLEHEMSKDEPNSDSDDNSPKSTESPAAKKIKQQESGAKKSRPLDLDKIKNTISTQAPKVNSERGSTIASTRRRNKGDTAGPKTDWKFSSIAMVSVVFIGLVNHIFSINGGMVLYDRFNLRYMLNPMLAEAAAKRIMADMLGGAPMTQPWLKSSFISDHSEYGLQMSWYHVVNAFWHAVTTGFVFLFVLTVARHLHHQGRLRITPHYLATVSALIFACHPLTSESVAYLSARSSLLGTNNFFLCLDFFLVAILTRQPIAKFCFVVLTLWAGAMSIGSNPECMTLPAVAFFTLLIIKGPLKNWQESMKDAPFLSGAAAFCALAVPFLPLLGLERTTANNLFTPTLATIPYVATQFKSLIFYHLRCLVLPLGLSIDPPFAIAQTASDPLAIVALLLFIGLAIFLASKTRQAIFGLAALLFIAGFLPHFCIVQPDAVADWVAYLPLTGVAIFAAYGLCAFAEKNLQAAAITLLVGSMTLSALTIHRDWQWSSTMTLWQSAISLNPESSIAHASVALEYIKRQDVAAAATEAELAYKLDSKNVLANLAKGKVLMAQGKLAEAGKLIDDAIEFAKQQKLPKAVQADCSLAKLEYFVVDKKETEANELIRKIAEQLAGDAKIFHIVGLAAYQQENYSQALQTFDKAMGMDPSLTECLPYMVRSAIKVGMYPQAMLAGKMYVDAMDCEDSRLMMAEAAILNKDETEASTQLQTLLDRSPKNAKALYMMSRMYKHFSKQDQAKKYEERAKHEDASIETSFPLSDLDHAEQSPQSINPGTLMPDPLATGTGDVSSPMPNPLPNTTTTPDSATSSSSTSGPSSATGSTTPADSAKAEQSQGATAPKTEPSKSTEGNSKTKGEGQ